MMKTPRRGKLADITKGGQEALDNAIAPPLPHPLAGEEKRGFPGVVKAINRKVTPDAPVRDLPAPVLEAVYAGMLVINGPKGAGMQWRSVRTERELQADPENLAEWLVTDPWGDVHMVVKMSEKGLERNIRAYVDRVKAEIAKGNERAAEFFAKRVAAIVHETLITGEWTC